MKGLLHSVPETVASKHPELEQLITDCLNGNVNGDRFVAVKLLLELLNKILVE